MGLAGGFSLPECAKISAKGTTSVHADTIWLDRESEACHIGQITAHGVCFLLLLPPVSYVWYLNCTSNTLKINQSIKIRLENIQN
jgi:hypothetical protein